MYDELSELSKTVKKYHLHFDDSAEAKSQALFNASGQQMQVEGIIDLQCRYKQKNNTYGLLSS